MKRDSSKMEVKEGRGDFSGDSLLSINGSSLPTVILPSGSLLVILEPGHASDIRFTGGQASGGEQGGACLQEAPRCTHLPLSGWHKFYGALCVLPHKSVGNSHWPFCSNQATKPMKLPSLLSLGG